MLMSTNVYSQLKHQLLSCYYNWFAALGLSPIQAFYTTAFDALETSDFNAELCLLAIAAIAQQQQLMLTDDTNDGALLITKLASLLSPSSELSHIITMHPDSEISMDYHAVRQQLLSC